MSKAKPSKSYGAFARMTPSIDEDFIDLTPESEGVYFRIVRMMEARGALWDRQASVLFGERDVLAMTGTRRIDAAMKRLERLNSARDSAGNPLLIVESDTKSPIGGRKLRLNLPRWPDLHGNFQQVRSGQARSGSEPSASLKKDGGEQPQPDDRATPPQPEQEPADHPLLRLLAKLEGEDDEKAAWLADELSVLEAEAADGGRISSLTVRYYRAYLKGSRAWRGIAARRNGLTHARKVAAHKIAAAAEAPEVSQEQIDLLFGHRKQPLDTTRRAAVAGAGPTGRK